MDGPPPQEEDFSSMPVAERLAHKNWKARVSAYETLMKTFQNTASDTDPAFKPYTQNPDLLKKIATDSNAVAQEKAIECLVAYVKFAGETAAKTRETVLPALVDKSYGSTRAGTKAHALELTLQYVEIENNGAGVVNDILPGLGAKQPKTVAGCVAALREIIRSFGIQTTPPPPVLKALPKIFSHSDKTVRAEGTLLTHTLYQYIGPALETWLAELKPVQVKELKEAFENMEKEGKGKGTLKPERLTRAQAREAEAIAESGGDGDEQVPDTGDDADAANFDPRAFAEPEDIVSKIPTSFSTALTSSKWKERKEVLDELQAVLNATPRIKDAPELGDVTKLLAVRVQADANINCVMTAAACLEALAKGMMASFSRVREIVVPQMLERLKERKASVTDAIGAALDAVFATTTLPDIIPDLSPALAHKNPQVKEGTLKFLGRCLANSKTPIQPPQIKPLAESLASLLEDSLEGCRNEAANCLGTLMKMVGERPLNAVIDPLADVRKAKIKEAFEKATVKCKAGGGTSAKPPAPSKANAPLAGPSTKKAPSKVAAPTKEDTLVDDIEPPKKVAKPPARLMQKTKAPSSEPSTAPPSAPSAPAASAPKKLPQTSSSKPAKSAAPAAPGALDTFKYRHTPEDAETLAADLIPATILTDLGDANWKTRLAALDEMSTWLDSVIEEVDSEVIIRSLAKKGWAEKNFQVSAKIYGICTTLGERSLNFGRSCIAICVPHMVEKLGDMKLKKPAGDALLVFGEKTSLQFVLNQAYEPLSKQKAPKVLADAIVWINSALTDFGIAGLSLRSLIDFLKTALQNSNATVRTSATKALVTMKLFAGSGIKDLLADLNPQLLNTITTEFDKVEGTAPPEPIRLSADVMSAPATSSQVGGGGNDALDDLFPRVEIDGLLKGTTVLADAKSEAWKTKKEALETLQSILDQGSNKRLKPSMGEIGQVLKARVVDTNKAVQTLALDIVARIATGMGKPFEKQTRFFVLPLTTVLADQKAPIRNAALTTLTAIANSCEGLDALVPGIASGLETANPLQKGTLLHWISDWFKEHQLTPGLDLSSWASSIVSSLDDRNGDVRKGAQALLPTLITSAGFDYVMQQTNSLKPASKASATPIIQAARPVAVAEPVASSSNAKTSAPQPQSQAPPSRSDSPSVAENPPSKSSGAKLTGVRRKLPLGSTRRPDSRSETPVEASTSKSTKPPIGGLKRPGPPSSAVKAISPAASPSISLPFFSSNIDARKPRCNRDPGRWINESGPTRKDLADLLCSQMEPHASKEVLSRLFSHDHSAINDHIAGIGMLCDMYNMAQSADESMEAVCLANFDLPLKYASIKAHEPQPNLISKCLELVETVVAFLRSINYQLTDNEALCFIPTIIFKLGDAREQVRVRVQNIIQSLPKVYAYSHVFQLLLEHGLKSKVAKTRQGSLDELATLLKKSGISACDPSKAFPVIASMISDKDSSVRKSALTVLSEGFAIVGEKVWTYVGNLPPKDRTQLEERLRRVAGPSSHDKPQTLVAPQIGRIAGSGLPRPGSPAFTSKIGGIPRPASPAIGPSRLARPPSPAHTMRTSSPTPSNRALSPSRSIQAPTTIAGSHISNPLSPTSSKRKVGIPSRLGRPKSHFSQPSESRATLPSDPPEAQNIDDGDDGQLAITPPGPEEITITISSILSSDPSRSVDALKKIQKILSVGSERGSSLPLYKELAEHTEGLIETITLQMAHIFERPDEISSDENFRLAKHLIQTLNNFCDHPLLAESLTIDILTSLLEELTLRLLETDDSPVKQVKDLSRFINMIILRLFATGRRMSVFRALFALLLQIVKPFPSNHTTADSQEAKVAELVLKCVWKLARSIPQDLNERKLDPVELFPAIEHFLQSVPPNEWRARATNKIPCGDMPLRTIKVIIQHVVAHYGDDVYDLLSAAFDDPSATIVYPYVYRILNSSSTHAATQPPQNGNDDLDRNSRPVSTASSRPISPQTASSATSGGHRYSPGHRDSPLPLNGNGYTPVEEPDPDAQLLVIIGHISSETTGALHKEGITELHHFLKAYPHKRPRVEKMLESTGAAFRKYINRALASRAAEDEERGVAVADTLSKLEANQREPPSSPIRSDSTPQSPHRLSAGATDAQDKLSRLHDIFQYRSSTASNGSSQGATRTSIS
ncbi:microtubule associated protein [Lentinula raphanica]|nr:microtubule associated protein [Lentinula raphanica]